MACNSKFKILIVDTKLGEDVAEEVISVDFTGDIAEVVRSLTDAHGQQVMRKKNIIYSGLLFFEIQLIKITETIADTDPQIGMT